ncbi:MAG: biopolymer transporter ExbD [Magnetococcales bacterium]|nr:biopolymer transporter ExbD [Magnetococcales bacterium]
MAGSLLDSESEDRPLAEINVTPLVDVMLVLLVIFIVLAPAITQSLQINLPRAVGTSSPSTPPVTVQLHADGSISIDQKTVDPSALAEYLRAAVGQNPDMVLRIDGDGATSYQQLAQLLSTAQNNGIHKIALTTQAP